MADWIKKHEIQNLVFQIMMRFAKQYLKKQKNITWHSHNFYHGRDKEEIQNFNMIIFLNKFNKGLEEIKNVHNIKRQ